MTRASDHSSSGFAFKHPNARIHLEHKFLADAYQLHLYDRHDGKLTLVTNLTLTTFDPQTDTWPDEAGIYLSEELAQQLMDDLWNSGLRPREERTSAGHARALADNLQDLRDSQAYAQQTANRLLGILETSASKASRS